AERGRGPGGAPGGRDPGPIEGVRISLARPVCATIDPMMLEREEYVEQAYFFRALRERMADGLATQTVLERVHQEILSTTRLPYAIQFLATEMKHSGQLSTGFARLNHYFTAFQTFVIAGTEDESKRFSADVALLVLEREAEYRAAGTLTRPGLFTY